MRPLIINKFGNLAGWASIKVNILGRNVEGITELEYKDDKEMNNEYGAGEFPVGQSSGNYKAEASITLYKEENIALVQSLPKGTYIQDIEPFDILVEYRYNNKLYTDVIRNCRFKNNGVTAKSGDGKFTHKYDLLVSHITWNN
jgi:hypothetical protein